MKQILVTDNLFIFPEHEQQLRDAGYSIERIDKPAATEDELVDVIKGRSGYILGGVEQVTDRVIDAADSLRAIVFTGIGYKGMIPGWKHATERGIAIGNVPDGPTQAVAEWAIGAALAMTRGYFELDRTSDKQFMTTSGLEGQTIGIIALGRIGRRIAEMVQVFRPKETLYYSTHRHEDAERAAGLLYAEMSEVLQKSDVVFLCVPDDAGHSFFGREHFFKMKQGALLVSFVHDGIIDADALYETLKNNKIRAISDYPMDDRFEEFPLSVWYSFNISNAFNTKRMLLETSDQAVKTLINLLETGNDQNLVNPEYREYVSTRSHNI